LLQLAQATAVLADGGVYVPPHLVSEIDHAETGITEPASKEPTHVIDLKPENLQVVRDAMMGVLEQGTARRAFAGASYKAAGKTGTAQVFSLRGARYNAANIDER